MAVPTFSLDSDALRKLLLLYVDVSDGGANPEWEPQGYKTEDASIEFNPDIETITDILGETHTTINKLERAMSLAPNTLRKIENRGKLNTILHERTRRGELSKLSTFKVLIAYGYMEESGAYAADMYPTCTITPQSLGGSSRVDFPYDINFGGTPQFGTVNELLPSPTFTEENTGGGGY